MLKKIKQDWVAYAIIGVTGFFGRDLIKFRTDNFEKMTEKFVLKEFYEKANKKRDEWQNRIEDKIDALLSKGTK